MIDDGNSETGRAGSLFSTQLFPSILTKIGTSHEVRTEIDTLTLLISPVE